MPRTRRFAPARRPKPATRWTGFNRFSFTQALTRSESVIYDPVIELARSGPGSKQVMLSVRGQLSLVAAAGTSAPQFAAYIAGFGTDESRVVTTGVPWDIMTQDIDIAQKRMLWMGGATVMPFDKDEAPVQIDIEVKVKIRLWPQMAILLVTQCNSDTNTCGVSGWARTLVTA